MIYPKNNMSIFQRGQNTFDTNSRIYKPEKNYTLRPWNYDVVGSKVLGAFALMEDESMFRVNENYLKLPGSYLFSTIAKKSGCIPERKPG